MLCPKIRIDVYDDELCTPLSYAIEKGRKEEVIHQCASIDKKINLSSNKTQKLAIEEKFYHLLELIDTKNIIQSEKHLSDKLLKVYLENDIAHF